MPAQSPNSTILVGALLLLMLPSPVGAQTEEEVEAAFSRSVACEDAEDMELYLETFPDGAYVTEAAGCLERGSDLDREARITIQQGLASLDFPMGPADGLFGPTTRSALRLWQGQKGFAATGYLTREQADVLIAQGGAAVAEEQEREAAARAAAEQVRQERAAAEEARRQRQAEEQRQRAAAEEARRQRAEAERAAAARTEEAARQAEEQRQQRALLESLAPEFSNSLGMEFMLIPPGKFQMGTDNGGPGQGPAHRVTISQPFYLGKTEVTQGQWQAVMGDNPSALSNCGANCPVENVSWEEVQAFIGKLNALEGGTRYRLPTEAEWEYAAPAGTETPVYTGDLNLQGWNNAPGLDAIAWYGGNSGVSYRGVRCHRWPEKQYDSSRCGSHPGGKAAECVWPV